MNKIYSNQKKKSSSKTFVNKENVNPNTKNEDIIDLTANIIDLNIGSNKLSQTNKIIDLNQPSDTQNIKANKYAVIPPSSLIHPQNLPQFQVTAPTVQTNKTSVVLPQNTTLRLDPTLSKLEIQKSLSSSNSTPLSEDSNPKKIVDSLFSSIQSSLKEDELTKEEIETPKSTPGMTIALLPYQVFSLRWFIRNEQADRPTRGGLLCDDMGLGKTVRRN